MKTLFIATDFSDSAYNAAKYGFAMAEMIEAKIVLFHVYQTAISIPEAYSVVNSEELKLAAEKELNRLSGELKSDSKQQVDCLAVEGDTDEMILIYAQKYEDCMIVCGKKSSGQFVQKLFGNTAISLINKCDVPLLIVPEGFVFRKINKITFATDLSLDTDIRTLSPLLFLGETCHSKLTVLRVMGNDLNVLEELNYRSERLNSYLKNLDPQYVFLKSDNVSNTIEKYLEDNNVDLISLMPRHHSFIEKVFITSESKKMFFLSRVPILYLPEVKIKFTDRSKETASAHA